MTLDERAQERLGVSYAEAERQSKILSINGALAVYEVYLLSAQYRRHQNDINYWQLQIANARQELEELRG